MAIQDNQLGTFAVPTIDVGLSALRLLLSGSLLFGILLILVSPPLRGPDETQHFLRAYGIAQGDFLPSIRDEQGRKGIFLPARLHAGFDYFETAREKRTTGYGPVFRTYLSHPPTAQPDDPPVFVPYAGSEGYSPIAYLPQSAAALVARVLDLDFLATQYLMRLAGLVAMSAILALAVRLAPSMAWPLVVIAMLPAALYGRSVINADGSALAGATMVVALWLRGLLHPYVWQAGRQSFWMTLSALTKPPNVTFVMLELAAPADHASWRWRALTLIVVPAIVIALIWSWASGGDTASWRMVEITGQEPASFDPAHRLRYLLSHPLHFPLAVIRALNEKDIGELWRQVIGVLGLFDTVLQGWVYPTLTAMLLAAFVARISSDAGDPAAPRARGSGHGALLYGRGLFHLLPGLHPARGRQRLGRTGTLFRADPAAPRNRRRSAGQSRTGAVAERRARRLRRYLVGRRQHRDDHRYRLVKKSPAL